MTISKRLLVVWVVIIGALLIIGSGGEGDSGDEDELEEYVIESITESENYSDGKVTIKAFALSADGDSDFTVQYDVSYNNPDYIYYQMDIYLIEKSETDPEDWDEDYRYVGDGKDLLTKAKNHDRISGNLNLSYNSSENRLYCKDGSIERYVYFNGELSDYYLMCVGSTMMMDMEDYSFSHYEAHVIIDIE